MHTLFLQLQGELWKLFARKRTYMGFVAFVALQIALFLVIRLLGGEERLRQKITQQGEAFDYYFSYLTLGVIITSLSVVLLGGLYLALVSGDIVAKESEDGTMRLLLARPISRLRLLSLKFFSCWLYSVVLMVFAAGSALLLGMCIRGPSGGLFALMPEQGILAFYEGAEGLRRYVLGALIMGWGMTVVSAIGFFFSCFKIKPAAATIAALSYLLIDFIVRQSTFMDDHEHFLITKHISAWAQVYADTIQWPIIIRSMTAILAIDLSLFVLGAAVFQSRDLKS
jgi:ABC-2 type transport system permease protein